MQKETTSIRIDPEVWREAKLYCVSHDIDLGDYVAELIRRDLKEKKG